MHAKGDKLLKVLILRFKSGNVHIFCQRNCKAFTIFSEIEPRIPATTVKLGLEEIKFLIFFMVKNYLASLTQNYWQKIKTGGGLSDKLEIRVHGTGYIVHCTGKILSHTPPPTARQRGKKGM